MYVLHASHPNDMDRICIFLRSVHLGVLHHEDGTITVSAPGAPTDLHERREIGGYVTTWNALNPSSPIDIVEAQI